MFGYRKGELEGKNVSLLMPQPYSGRHNGYLRNFQTTGQPKILDKTQEVGPPSYHLFLTPNHIASSCNVCCINGYLRNLQTTRQPKVLDKTQEVGLAVSLYIRYSSRLHEFADAAATCATTRQPASPKYWTRRRR